MAYEHRCVVDSPIEAVFAWHARPGALERLTPPWQPVKVSREAASLRDGTAVLALPGGIKWTAVHQPGEYDEPSRFVDVLTTPVLASAIPWRHVHDFADLGEGRTEVTDRVETRVPDRFLQQVFAYRCRQLTGDLRSHRQPAAHRAGPMTVAVTGSSGLVGSALTAFLTTGGHKVIRLVRNPTSQPDSRVWDPANPAPDILDGVDALIHLAGASVAGRFTESHKAAVRASRVEPTRSLARLTGARTFVTASAVGIYGPDRGEEELTESSARGSGFLADLVADWEAAAEPARQSGARVVHVRTGIVQSPRGGLLRLLRPIFEAGVGGPLGSGQQWMSWIGIDDLLDIYLRGLVDASIEGPINAVSPNPVRNRDYTATLARVLRRPAVIPVPPLAPRLLLGPEGVEEFVLANQRVLPSRLVDLGHELRYPGLEEALRHGLGRTAGSGYPSAPTR
jgi:uncharacterized protein (TIGR01777 family)